MLTKREAMFIVTTGNPVKLGGFYREWLLELARCFLLGKRFLPDKTLILTESERVDWNKKLIKNG